ncbi:MAG: hypothetical protein KA223_08080 [Candidatus Accumulibacter sp.]|nr:hypothetical protein [Accumulibacter sp.]
MKRLLFAAVLGAASGAGSLPIHAADVGISVSIGQPGYYGRLDLGTYPPPQLIYRQPMVVERVPVGRPPVYLNVPPGQAKNWRKNCHRYNACGERVYLVRNDWYQREYVPRYHEYHRDRSHDRPDDYRDDHRGKDKNKNHGDPRDQGHHR